MRFKTQFSGKIPHSGEYFNEPSLTTPNMSMSIQEIMRRHVQGRPLPKSRPMFYSGDQELPNPLSMSEMDMQDALKIYNDVIKNGNEQLEQRKKARKKAIEDSKKAGSLEERQNDSAAIVLPSSPTPAS